MPGSWQSLNNNANVNIDAMLLLTGGSVMCHEYLTVNWFRLVPDEHSDYANGTWIPISPMPNNAPAFQNGPANAPLYFASAVLRDGTVFCAGGEDNAVYNGVDLARFHPDNRPRWRGDMRTSLGIPAEAWLIAFVGSGFERKGLGPLLDAVARLGDRRVRVLVAGKGRTEAYREMAARLGVADAVTWVAPRPDVERIYATADVVALPARYEPFGNVHLEALASGVPVVTSMATGGAEVVGDGVSGAVVATPAPEEIARGLRGLRDSDAGRLRVAARAAAEPFTYAAQVEGLEEIYRRLA